jgi:hypothetical protein
MALFRFVAFVVNGWVTLALVSKSTTAISDAVPGRNAETKLFIADCIWPSSVVSMLPELSMTSTMSRPQDGLSAGFGWITRRRIVAVFMGSQFVPVASTVTVPVYVPTASAPVLSDTEISICFAVPGPAR